LKIEKILKNNPLEFAIVHLNQRDAFIREKLPFGHPVKVEKMGWT
jgi:hypothetical protein